jgi:hypothetical protein
MPLQKILGHAGGEGFDTAHRFAQAAFHDVGNDLKVSGKMRASLLGRQVDKDVEHAIKCDQVTGAVHRYRFLDACDSDPGQHEPVRKPPVLDIAQLYGIT